MPATTGTEFPGFLKLEYDGGKGAFVKAQADLNAFFNSAQNRMSTFSLDAQRTMEQALSIPRNKSGSLDLNLPELRDAAKAQEARAVAAREVANALGATARVEGIYGKAMRESIAEARSLAAQEEALANSMMAKVRVTELVQQQLNKTASATDLVTQATGRGTTANHMMVNSQRASRQASIQTGQQLQDLAISLYGGQRASVVFAQQLPQLAFALSGVGGRVGAIATTLSGPWSLALVAGSALLGGLIERMISTSDAAEKAKAKTFDFSRSLDLIKESAGDAADAMAQLGSEITSTITKYGDLLATKSSLADQGVADAERRLSENRRAIDEQVRKKADGGGGFGSVIYNAATIDREISRLEEERTKISEELRNARSAQTVARVALSQRTVEESLKPNAQAVRVLTDQMDALTRRRRDSQELDDRLARGDPHYAAALKQRTAGYISEIEYIKQVSALRARQIALDEKAQKVRAVSDGVSRFRSREQAIGVAGRELLQGGFRVSENVQFGGVHANHPGMGNAAHGQYALDVNVGTGINESKFPDLSRQFDDLARRYQARGYKVVWNGKVYLPGGDSPSGNAAGHDNHLHIEAPQTIVDKPTQGGTEDAARREQAFADSQIEFGQRASAAIASISSRFDEQPRMIDQTAAAMRELDAIIADLGERNIGGVFDPLILAARAGKELAGSAVARDIAKVTQENERQFEVQGLIVTGREREAFVLQALYSAQEKYGDLLPEQVAEISAAAEAQYDSVEALRRAQEAQAAYLDATRSIRSEVEAILAGQGKLSNLKNIFKQLQGRVLTEQIFGSVFRDMDAWIKQNTPLGKATDMFTAATDDAGKAAIDLAKKLREAGDIVSGQRVGGGVGAGDSLETLFDKEFAARSAANDNNPQAMQEIVVTARRLGSGVMSLSPVAFFTMMGDKFGAELTTWLEPLLGSKAAGLFGSVAGGALGGYAAGGMPGAILGGLKEIKGLPDSISEKLGDALKGSATGTAVDGIGKSLGIKMSSTGAQIGGAIGGATGIPGGDIIGAIAGGIIGNLFKSAKTGKASIGGIDGGLGVTATGGNTGSFIKAASGAADSVTGAIQRIADAFGASVDAAVGNVTVGIRDGKWRVNTGGSSLKLSGGATNFGKDGQAEAIAFATADLIRDGVLQGLKQGTQTLLQKAGADLDTQLQKALSFEGVFSDLKAILDPVGAAIDTIDKQFTSLKKIFTEANATTEDYVSLEQLYNLKRAEAVEQARKQLTGSLQSLYDTLTIGDSGLSLNSRIEAARAAFDPLKARVQAGDTTAFDSFAAAGQTLLGLMRELHGSTTDYFTFFDELKGVTKSALDAVTAKANQSAATDPLFGGSSSAPTGAADNAGVVAAIDAQTSALLAAANQQISMLSAVNDNLGALITKGGVMPASSIAFSGTY